MVIGKFIITPLGDGLFSIMITGNSKVLLSTVDELEQLLQNFYDEQFKKYGHNVSDKKHRLKTRSPKL